MASTRTSKRRPSPSDYGHTPESGPRTLGIRAPYQKILASSVPEPFLHPWLAVTAVVEVVRSD
ncbi:hypothetical protein T12_10123 [Trichinella patagoniensis]|uniref:Uncharacterized protein n=1 Tax=Trichinella patagoniensis TaxID=990121 RepID=A0A0V0ZT74_9BILA|nr:hypothetical protein T12_10123 [Trichinella patagoniensis]